MDVGGILKDKGRHVETTNPETSVQDAAAMLCERKIGALVILQSNGNIAGVLSERDVIRAIVKGGAGVLKKPVSDFMTTGVVCCGEADTVPQLMETMTRCRFRHVPVVENGKLTGIVSIGDVVKRRIAEAEFETKEMKRYIASA